MWYNRLCEWTQSFTHAVKPIFEINIIIELAGLGETVEPKRKDRASICHDRLGEHRVYRITKSCQKHMSGASRTKEVCEPFDISADTALNNMRDFNFSLDVFNRQTPAEYAETFDLGQCHWLLIERFSSKSQR